MNWLNKNQEKILFFTWCFIILTCLLVIFTSPVKASAPDYSLPYVVEDRLIADLDTFKDNYIAICERDGIFPMDVDWDSDMIIGAWSLNDGANGTTYIFVPENDGYYSVSLSEPYSTFDIHEDHITITFYNYVEFVFGTSSSIQPEFYGLAHFDETFSANFLGEYHSVDFISGDFYDNDGNIIFTFNSGGGFVDSGHASEPVEEHGHYIDDGNGNRIPKPNKPTPSVYTPPTIQFPSIDTSSVEKLLESLIDLVQYGISYLGGVIGGWFSNLLSNLDSWFDYVVSSFNYAINNVVGSIKDLAETFYNNMVSLFEPLYEFFNGVATFFNNLVQLGMDGDSFSLSTFFYNLLVPDSEDFAQALLDGDIHHVVPLVSSVHSKFVSLFNSFSNLTPSKVLLIPSFTWHGQTFNLSIDFSWYDDYKVYGDTIISGFLIIGYIYWFVLQLSSMFRGGNSIGHDVSKVGGHS